MHTPRPTDTTAVMMHKPPPKMEFLFAVDVHMAYRNTERPFDTSAEASKWLDDP